MRRIMPTLTLIAITVLGLVGCGDDPKPATRAPSPATPQVVTETLPTDLFLAAEPPDSKSLNEIKSTAKNGDRVVVKARIAGRKDPFVAQRAVMIVADLGFPTCTEASPMDQCETPWDFCCDPGEVIASNTASVQVVGTDGRPLKTALANVGGLAPNKKIVIAGIVQKSPDDSAVTVNATGIFVPN